MGHEKTLTALFPALAGANVIYGLGNTESGVLMDYGQMVMDNEFAGMIKFALQGIPVSDATLAVDVIREVGSFRDYLSHDHTMEFMRTHQSLPELIDRTGRREWQAAGAKTIYEKSWDKALDIIATHRPPPLPEDVRQELEQIIDETAEELAAGRR